MPVLLVVFEIPESIEEQIRRLRERISGVRWKSEFSLTTNYVGEVSARQVDAACESLTELETPRLRLLLANAGTSTHEGVVRTLYFGLHDPAPVLPLRAAIEARLEQAGIAPKRQKFNPHVTVAHLSRDCDHETLGRWIEKYEEWHSYSFEVAEIELRVTYPAEDAGGEAKTTKQSFGLR